MSEKNKVFLFNLLKEPGNDSCVDCGEKGKTPDWASENLGVFLCIKCSGIHRNLGKHFSFVRSLRLDHWADDKCEEDNIFKVFAKDSSAVDESNMSGQIGLKLFELLSVPGNAQCADCGSKVPPPRWASSSIGILLCVNCVGIHRGLGVNLSITKSIELDKWTEPMYQFMASMGNEKANKIWAKSVPICWKKPTPLDHNLDFYVEEWIRAKYERKEFREENSKNLHYCSGEKVGFLSKRERHSNKWNQRYFRLSAQTCSLTYYNKKDDLSPIRRMDLKTVNVMLCDSKKTDKFFSMQISSPEEKQKKGKKASKCIRNIYVHAETGKDIVDWYLAIRAARFKVLELDESDCNVGELLSTDYIKEGWLRKSGPKENDRYQQRWITVERNKFSYFDDKLDSVPKHEVVLKNLPELFSVSEGADGKHPEEPHPFMVQTPERVYNFGAETDREMEDWMRAFRKGIELNQHQPHRLYRMSVASAVSEMSQLSVSSSDSTSSS